MIKNVLDLGCDRIRKQTKNDILKRRGRFKISRRMIENDPMLIKRIMGEMIIVRAELMWIGDEIEYVAYSKLFDIIPEQEESPFYKIIFMMDKGKVKEFKVERSDNL